MHGAHRRPLPAPAVLAWLLLVASPALAGPTPEITVRSAAELVEALRPERQARLIRLHAGRYPLAAPLAVPDGVELAGAGVMRFDPDGLPAGFVPGTETVLVASDGLRGDVVTLGDGVLLKGLRIEGAALVPGKGSEASGNIVVIASRRPGDRLEATLHECEVVNNREFGYAGGPTGRAVVVMTVNPDGAAWHEGARVFARIERSIVRNTSDSNTVFAINFAGGGTIELDFERNRFEGSIGATGGAGRPDMVRGASTTLRSRGNLYLGTDGPYAVGWQLIGGSVSPHHPLTEGAESNLVRVDSQDDRIEGFRVAVEAVAGRPIVGVPGQVVNNRGELLLSGLRIKSTGESPVDLSLHGAKLFRPRGASMAAASGTEGNVLRVTLRDSTGSGPRANVYADRSPPEFAVLATAPRSDRLEISGSRTEFLESNSSVDPAPELRYFTTPASDR